MKNKQYVPLFEDFMSKTKEIGRDIAGLPYQPKIGSKEHLRFDTLVQKKNKDSFTEEEYQAFKAQVREEIFKQGKMSKGFSRRYSTRPEIFMLTRLATELEDEGRTLVELDHVAAGTYNLHVI